MAPRERPWLVRDSPEPAGNRIFSRRIELRLLTVLSGIGRFIGPAHAKVDGQVARGLEVVLHISGMAPPAGQPGGERLRELGLPHIAKQQVRKIVSGGSRRGEGEFCPAHEVLA